MTQTKTPLWLWVSVVIAGLLSLLSLSFRYRIETANRSVSLAAEYEVVESLASGQAWTVDRALGDLRAQGLTSLVLSEETIGELISAGKITMISTSAPNAVSVLSLHVNDPALMPRLQRGLSIRFHDLAGRLQPRGNVLVLPQVSAGLIRGTSVGLNPAQAQLAHKNGMIIVGRFGNPVGVSSEAVQETLKWAKELGTTVFLPQGDQVLGRRDALESTDQALEAYGMHYASAEFAKIGGDTEMVAANPQNVIRLHSAQAAELDKLTAADAVERYAKAARERGMRILLVRPLSSSADAPLAAYADFLKKISQRVQHQGGAMGEPRPFGKPSIPSVLFAALGLAVAPVVWFLGCSFTTQRKVRLVGAVLVVLLGLACFVGTGRSLMALAVSVAYPTVGFVVLTSMKMPRSKEFGDRLLYILSCFALVSLFSIMGGLAIGGLLNDIVYYVRAKEFIGTKFSIIVPVLLVAGYYFARLSNWREDLKSPIVWGSAALSLVIAGILAFLIARTGNDTGASAGGGEMAFRGLLDRILYVRPRTKEFLFGHPALVIALGMLTRVKPRSQEDPVSGWNRWTVLVIMLGAIGQTSVVNTLCHMHIPVTLSLARIVEGLVLGCILGIALWAILDRMPVAKEA